MIGHERINDLRLKGFVEAVSVNVGHGELYSSKIHFDASGVKVLPVSLPVVDPVHPEIFTQDTNPIPQDLRWLSGVDVFIRPRECDVDFYHAWLSAIARHKPSAVYALSHDQKELITWPE